MKFLTFFLRDILSRWLNDEEICRFCAENLLVNCLTDGKLETSSLLAGEGPLPDRITWPLRTVFTGDRPLNVSTAGDIHREPISDTFLAGDICRLVMEFVSELTLEVRVLVSELMDSVCLFSVNVESYWSIALPLGVESALSSPLSMQENEGFVRFRMGEWWSFLVDRL